jgi:hypothetical protein
MAHMANPNEMAEGGRMSTASWWTIHPMAHMATLINANQAEETTVSRKCMRKEKIPMKKKPELHC